MDPKNLKRCVVPFCDTRASSGLSKFPQKDENRKNIWLELLEIKEVKLNDRICHKHFTENDFQNFKNRRVLSPKAVPSLHLPQHIQISFHDDIQWLLWCGFRGFLGTHKTLSSGFRNPQILRLKSRFCSIF